MHISSTINKLRPRQDGRHFADDIFTCNFFNENCCILIKFLLKYVRKGPIDNNAALVQIMAWRRSGDKPLSEPMMVCSPTHICVSRPQWVNAINRSHERTPKINVTINLYVTYWSVNAMKRLAYISWWRHQMETFSALLAICAANSTMVRLVIWDAIVYIMMSL